MDEVVMVKLLVLQQWYGLNDTELERQVADRISFQRFLGFLEILPDYSTVWHLRERLAESGRDRLVWEEPQRHLDERGLKVKKGVVQDGPSSPLTRGSMGSPGERRRRRGGAGWQLDQEGEQILLWVQAARQDRCRLGPHPGPGDDGGQRPRQPG